MTIRPSLQRFFYMSTQVTPTNFLNRFTCRSSFITNTTAIQEKSSTSSLSAHTSSELLTLSTAKQLKGDIPEAISLANDALEKQRIENDPHAIADTSVFLGKLYQIEQRYPEAERSFQEAHSIHKSLSSESVSNAQKRNEYVSLAHVAHAQKKLSLYPSAERNFISALSGLSSTVGWTDGATNHTCFELARLYRELGRDEDAVKMLRSMKHNLSLVFGEGDTRVVQINEELADISLLLGDRVNAIDLLNEVVDSLPPNSPEARRAFSRLEDLKEEEEMGVEVGGCGVKVTEFRAGKK